MAGRTGRAIYSAADKMRIGISALLVAVWAGLANGSIVLTAFDRAGLLFFRQSGDTSVLAGPTWMGSFALGLSHVGGTVALVTLSLGLVAVVWRKVGDAEAGRYAFAVAGGMLSVTALKILFHRVRPEVVSHLMHETSASFPSGHATRSSIVYLITALFLARLCPGRERTFQAVAILLALAVGVSRVMVGVHWPSDVIGGWLTALFWLSLCAPFLRGNDGKEHPEA